MARTLAVLVCGGIAGTLARAGINAAFARLGGPWPWWTFAVNLSGCLLMGFFDAASVRRGWGSQARLALMTGFCGAYTTFSALILELDAMLAAAPLRATGYLGASVALGLACFKLGSLLGG